MARARNIKPSLFKNEILGVADPLLTILFESLWCLADKEGRLEDRPLRIKAETFPYRENLDINGYLTQLEQLGFIRRYVVGGVAYIQVINFLKHQTPHSTEKASVIPKEPKEKQRSECDSGKPPLDNGETTQAKRPDSLLLIPDSGLSDSPNPDSRIPIPEITPSSGKPDPCAEILEYLNLKARRSYRAVDTNLRLIGFILKSGVSVDDCKRVIDLKVKKWQGDPKMDEFLRPGTLFRKSNFENYVGALDAHVNGYDGLQPGAAEYLRQFEDGEREVVGERIGS